jgi:hypothetical protein
MIDFAGLNDESIGSSYSTFDFDASVTEIYQILLYGMTLIVVPYDDRNDTIKLNAFFNNA